jgi:hypothetical protein
MGEPAQDIVHRIIYGPGQNNVISKTVQDIVYRIIYGLEQNGII